MSAHARIDAALDPGGPRLVAIGGGHGLARTLEAARRFASSITAVVSVADDGGSSGRLRELLDIPAPGDIRRCLGALAPDSALAASLEHRFGAGELEGHAFGNLLLAALSATMGDFAAGVEEACALLGTLGTVLPATTSPVVLRATELDGSELAGQTRVTASCDIERVFLEPADPEVPKAVVAAIADAELVVIGPGSLYTSVLAAVAPGPIVAALAATSARVVYVSNLAEEPPETAGYDVGRHVDALVAHFVRPDVVVVSGPGGLPIGTLPVDIDLVVAPLARPNGKVHDAALLAAALAPLSKAR